MLNCKSKPISYSRVVWSGDLTNTDLPKSDLTSGYSYYLCFSVTQRTNKLMFNQMDRYSTKQTKIYCLINSLNQSGFGYRRISKYLNSKRILTFSGKVWTPSLVHAVLKRFRQRQERLKRINRRYPIFRSKMSMRFERE